MHTFLILHARFIEEEMKPRIFFLQFQLWAPSTWAIYSQGSALPRYALAIQHSRSALAGEEILADLPSGARSGRHSRMSQLSSMMRIGMKSTPETSKGWFMFGPISSTFVSSDLPGINFVAYIGSSCPEKVVYQRLYDSFVTQCILICVCGNFCHVMNVPSNLNIYFVLLFKKMLLCRTK